jgi:hypothetical protein
MGRTRCGKPAAVGDISEKSALNNFIGNRSEIRALSLSGRIDMRYEKRVVAWNKV